ncbi:nucleotidyltransferase [Telmatobacter sp. DSM 110680]|uniref:Nucleotidyltransferase n=1 Tax=Telmatobacter sp. DSM 110680 TaxID=3036704 RepID=A0AAU7DQ59_9BACT
MATLPSSNRNWENVFGTWGCAPSATDQEKCERALLAVRKAINADTKLCSKNIEVFVQGSYANRTNVRQDSDVDVCVLYKGAWFSDYAQCPGLNSSALGLVDSLYSYVEFKNDVGSAIRSYFNADSFRRGNKAFDIHANSYRIDADVVPCFEYRRYFGTAEDYRVASGTELIPDNGQAIINWPRQNYDNGVIKNNATSRRFKALVRIFKCLRNEMVSNGHSVAEAIPSYLIECLIFNVPDGSFGSIEYRADVRAAIVHLWNATLTDEMCDAWREVNGLKYLIRPGQPWTRAQVNSFLHAAWNYIGFK